MPDPDPPPPPPGADVRIHPYDVARAPEPEQRALYEVQRELRRERLPDEPPYPFAAWQAEQRARLELRGERFEVRLARDPGGRPLGYAGCLLSDDAGHRHRLQATVAVLPGARRRGVGRALLRAVVAVARREARTLVAGVTVDTQPGGEAALRHLGAAPGLAAHTRQLRLADLDRTLLRRWIDAAPRERYRLERWDAGVPEAQLAAFIDLNLVMADQPHGELEEIREPLAPERIREYQAYDAARGLERWLLLARSRQGGDGAPVGYTEMSWDPAQPHGLWQGDTGVRPEHRGRGLGRWLKAAMLERVLAERPEARWVRTGNADANAPMLAINEALGFAPFLAERWWEVPLDVCERYLERSPGTPVGGGAGGGRDEEGGAWNT